MPSVPPADTQPATRQRRRRTQAENFVRSAIAPVINAGVITANIIWKATKAVSGIVSPGSTWPVTSRNPTKFSPPIRPRACIRAEGQRVPDQHPEDSDRGDAEEVRHQHGEHVLGPDHAAIKQGEAGGHEQHERGADQHPRGIAGVDLQGRSSVRWAACARASPGGPDGF